MKSATALACDLFRLSRREYFADFWITPPLTIGLAAWSIHGSFGPLWLPLFAIGWVLWTLYEYGLHRFGLHGAPLLRDVHGLHHRDPRDYIALHPAATLAIYAGFYVLFGLHASAISVGFSSGYVVYAALHTAIHYSDAHWLGGFKRRHAAHHRLSHVNYGVTTGFWDRLFGTECKLKPTARKGVSATCKD